ncbi:methyltransferase domain-containing protein [Crossiella sp. CA-258035]|uniref:class I SAM-dependent methyltransferase n=1 Tax=Crossiella sp. CA-258035 TaxID=2981138 RepID=UPI0024BC182F|nr:methyltransferase domain-containing protein [Crossiella sp. CA-258035]WHT15662.1 methyltransferase domain-containing protein [Crossiella sp. CA-258035]
MRTRPAGDFDYETHGAGYAQHRRTDPRIAALVHAALGEARTVVNVGAGAGSYEPVDRHVIAIEPAAAMRAQRPPHLAPAINGIAEELPLDDHSVDAAMATITVHQWAEPDRGLRELRRVSRGPVVVLCIDGAALAEGWFAEYAPEVVAVEAKRYQPIQHIAEVLGGATVTPVPVPLDCADGFTDAFYGRPERFLEPAVRRAQSGWGFVGAEAEARFVAKLTADLESGEWDRRFGHLRTQPEYDSALRLLVAG